MASYAAQTPTSILLNCSQLTAPFADAEVDEALERERVSHQEPASASSTIPMAKATIGFSLNYLPTPTARLSGARRS